MEEDEDADCRNSKKYGKRQENNIEDTLDLEPKTATDQSVKKKKNKKQNKATCDVVNDDEEETPQNHQIKRRKVYIENRQRIPSLLKHRQSKSGLSRVLLLETAWLKPKGKVAWAFM